MSATGVERKSATRDQTVALVQADKRLEIPARVQKMVATGPTEVGIIAMGAKKKQVPAFVDPPGALAPIEDWIEHRRELDRLETELRVSHLDLAWSDEL